MSWPVPSARTEHLIATENGREVLVYDEATHQIHHLNEVSAAIWRLCDGTRTVEGIVRDAQVEFGVDVTGTTVEHALSQLASAGLLDGELDAGWSVSGQSRRSILKRAAVVGAVAAPSVVSISAPSSAGVGTPEQCEVEACGDDDTGRSCAIIGATFCGICFPEDPQTEEVVCSVPM